MPARTVTLTVRLEPELLEKLSELAAKIGHGATVAGVVRQLIMDRVAK
jgi:predicted transcriptional regulator